MVNSIYEIIDSLPSCEELVLSEDYKVGAQYIRVSTDDQVELSPITQLKLGLEFAHSHKIVIPREYVFIEHGGVSGRNVKKRHEFNRMIALTKSKDHYFDSILVWRFSRFARNQEESIVYKSLLAKSKIDVISITEPIDDSPFGKLNERIIEWMDEYYSIRLSDEVLRGMKENARRGVYQANPPIGYDYVGEKKPPSINEHEKIIVQKIFDSFLNGSSFTQIARMLNESGFRSKRGGFFEARTICYILQNPFYVGKVRWNYFDRSSLSYNEENEVIVANGAHDPIINVETWNLVQEQLKVKIKPFRKRDVSTCKHWLSGVLVCSHCHKSLAFSSIKKNDYTYQQFKCWGYTKGKCLVNNSIRVDLVEKYILAGLEQVIKSKNRYHFELHSSSNIASELDLLKSLLKKLDLKEKRFKYSYASGIDTLSEYKENKLFIQSERKELDNKIIALSNTKPDTNYLKENMLTNINSVYHILISGDQDFIQKGNAIRSIVDYIVFDKATCTFQFYFHLLK